MSALVALAIGMGVPSPSTVLAETSPPVTAQPTAEDLRWARESFEKAREDERAHRWEEAFEKFQRIGEMAMTLGVRSHIAYCEENLRHFPRAADTYIAAMAQARAENKPEIFNLLLDRLIAIRHRMSTRDEAQKLQTAGVKQMGDGDPQNAQATFAKAYELYPHLKILWNMTVAEEAAGQHERASRHLHALLASRDPYMTDAKRTAAQARLERVRKKLGAISVSESRGTRVSYDGKPAPEGYAPGDAVEFAPGTHAIEIEAAGRKRQKTVVVHVGEVTHVPF